MSCTAKLDRASLPRSAPCPGRAGRLWPRDTRGGRRRQRTRAATQSGQPPSTRPLHHGVRSSIRHRPRGTSGAPIHWEGPARLGVGWTRSSSAAGGSPPPDSAGAHQGSSGTAACLPWPSGTRSWATPARCRPPPWSSGSGEARVRPCRRVGLPRRIPSCGGPAGAAGPEVRRRRSSGHHSKARRDHGGGGQPAARRTNRKIMQTDPSARHSPIGLFQRVWYLVHLARDGRGCRPWTPPPAPPS
jgi:hypothetical protein